MGKAADAVKRLLYRSLPLDSYLRTMSRAFFIGFRLCPAADPAAYEYPRFLKRLVRSGDTAIDIGANLGYYSRIISRLAGERGRVYAVEPVGAALGVLQRNLRGRANAEIMPFALGGENKNILMGNDSPREGGYMGTGRNYVMDGTARAEMEFSAVMRRGSELFAGLERLDFIKCDVEGYETSVIPEMAPVIEKFLPVALVETGGANRGVVQKLFAGWGYGAFVLDRGRLVPAAGAPEKDIVFIPEHRRGEFEELIEI